MTGETQKWIPILDYAVLRGVSTSTLRRYIKAKKIQYKIENGRYLLLAEANVPSSPMMSSQQQQTHRPHNWDGTTSNTLDISMYARVRELEDKLAQAQEQISELKMLVAIYEEKLSG